MSDGGASGERPLHHHPTAISPTNTSHVATLRCRSTALRSYRTAPPPGRGVLRSTVPGWTPAAIECKLGRGRVWLTGIRQIRASLPETRGLERPPWRNSTSASSPCRSCSTPTIAIGCWWYYRPPTPEEKMERSPRCSMVSTPSESRSPRSKSPPKRN